MSHATAPIPVRGRVVSLRVPCDPMFLRIVRTSCVSAMALVVADYDRLNDLRLAVEELAVVLVHHAAPNAPLDLGVTIDATHVLVEASVDAAEARSWPTLSDVATMVVSSIADDWRLERDGDLVTAHLWLSRRSRSRGRVGDDGNAVSGGLDQPAA